MESITELPESGHQQPVSRDSTRRASRRQSLDHIRSTFSLTLDTYAFGPAASFAPGIHSEDQGAFAAEYRACRSSSKGWPGVQQNGALKHEGTSTFSASVANLTKSMVGIGLLTIPRAFADCSVGLAVGALLFCGTLSAMSFFILGYCAHITGSRTLPQLWEATVGPRSTPFVELMVLVDTSLSCVAFALLIADYSALSVVGLFPELPEFARSRRFLVVLITLSVLLPLCMAKHLSLLRFSSMVGLACTMVVFVYVVGDSAASGFRPEEGPLELDWFRLRPAGLLSGTARFAVAFMAHFNAPAFYADMKGRRPSRFASMAAIAYSIAFLIYCSFGFSGYARFGADVPGNALASYELSNAVLMMWLGMGVCMVASFPLLFAALRDALLRLLSRCLGSSLDARDTAGKAVTVVAVLLITFVGAESKDLSLVVSLLGSISGTMLAFVVPGAVMLSVRRRQTATFAAVGWTLLILGSTLSLASFAAVVCRDVLEWI